jgi:hypothetical protein
MAVWEDFEIECTEYLNKTFGKYANFVHQGGSDSTVPDIWVKTYKGTSFYIDAKHCPAQCGQFVLLPDIKTNTFEYSKLNSTRINVYAQNIMNHMNTYFEDFKEAGTGGKEIILDDGDDTFAKWIINTYKSNGVKYFITNDYVILPVDDFQRHFDVTAKYRIKRSGSSNTGKARIVDILNHIRSLGYLISDKRTNGDKLFVKSQASLHNKRFIFQGNEYMFSLRGNEYEIRKLSNTFNANVIFSINKKQASGLTNEQFVKELE